jgi:hypothetical protein
MFVAIALHDAAFLPAAAHIAGVDRYLPRGFVGFLAIRSRDESGHRDGRTHADA